MNKLRSASTDTAASDQNRTATMNVVAAHSAIHRLGLACNQFANDLAIACSAQNYITEAVQTYSYITAIVNIKTSKNL